jgi:hypothetical protein
VANQGETARLKEKVLTDFPEVVDETATPPGQKPEERDLMDAARKNLRGRPPQL